jgi:hypothetical protein
MPKKEAATTPRGFVLNAAADIPDLRDRMYEPPLIKLEEEIEPDAEGLNIRNQGTEGACTGFALAAAIDLLNARRGYDDVTVSARMLYEVAKRFDEWTGEDYEGSSIRGAIRGWWHNGVCPEELWPYKKKADRDTLTVERAKAAHVNALGAYYRLRPNLTDFHAALNEAGVLCASARVHEGWYSPARKSGLIKKGKPLTGGHAFSVVGYNGAGFWIQNSWGKGWGKGGLALWPYEDWAENLMDAWVFRMAVPTPQVFDLRGGTSSLDPASRAEWLRAPKRKEIAGHFVHIDDGEFQEKGRYNSRLVDVEQTAERVAASSRDKYRHLLFYAHGGLNSPATSATRIRAMKDVFRANGIYPFHFMYDTGLVEELMDVILRKSERTEQRVGGFFDFTDKIFEGLISKPGTLVWKEMKRGARSAFKPGYAGYATLKAFAEALDGTDVNVHLAGHSTGGVLLAHLLEALDGIGVWNLPISSCSLMAPAATTELYSSHYAPRLGPSADSRIRLPKLHVYNLSDKQEQDDTVTPLYHKSLLYLVSNAFEDDSGKPLLGMEKFSNRLRSKPGLRFFYSGGKPLHTESTTHGGFDNDTRTMNSILRAILGPGRVTRPFTKKDLGY